jgi:Ca-activated chloride channel family protein
MQQPATLRVEVSLVTVGVRIKDKQGKDVPGLNRNDLELYEDGVRQPISFFSSEPRPLSVALLLDRSDSMSMGGKFGVAKSAVNSLMDSLPAGSEYLYLPFSLSWPSAASFTDSIEELKRSVAATKLGTRTRLYDAVLTALERCRAARYGRQSLVVITDGVDSDSVHTLDEVIRSLRGSQVQIFTVGYFSERERDMLRDRKGILRVGEYPLSVFMRLARESGGEAFFPDSDQSFQVAAQRISADLRTQYTIGYYPTNTLRDGRYRRIEVRLPNHRGCVVRARQGYILEGADGIAAPGRPH